MQEEFYKIFGIIIIIFLLIYIYLKFIKFKSRVLEGLTGSNNTTSTLTSNISSYSTSSLSQYNMLQAQLNPIININNSRTDIDQSIINMDDYVSALMLKQFLSFDIANMSEESVTNLLVKLNVLNDGKKSLNTLIKNVTIITGIK